MMFMYDIHALEPWIETNFQCMTLDSHEKGLETLHPNGDRSLGCCFLIVNVHLNRDRNIKFDVLLLPTFPGQ